VYSSELNCKIFSGKEIKMSLVRPKKPEKPSVPKQKRPISHPQITFKINPKFTIIPAKKRKEYVEKLPKMLKALSFLAQMKVYLLWRKSD